MEPAFSIKSRSREREFLLVTLLILLAIAGWIRPLFAYSTADLEKIWGYEFTQAQLPFAYVRDILFPNACFLVLLYACYCWMSGGIQRLGDMMRFMLHENHLQSIPMSKESEYLKNYIALMRLRTQASNSIRIETIIDGECPGFSIAPMLLIPFVENGFKHGISLREPSWLKLRLHCAQKRIVFEMRNSIHVRQGDDPEKDRSGIGLRNVLHRLKLLYPDDAIDYLLKPFSQSRFLKACNKAYELYELKRKKGTTQPEEKLLSRLTMTETEALLPPPAFIRIHRSYLVASGKVEKIERDSLWVGGRELPVGPGYASCLQQLYR